MFERCADPLRLLFLRAPFDFKAGLLGLVFDHDRDPHHVLPSPDGGEFERKVHLAAAGDVSNYVAQ